MSIGILMASNIQWFLERTVEALFSSFRSWGSLVEALSRVPRTFVNFSDALAWPYLLSSIALAWLMYVFTKRNGTADAASFRDFAFPSRIYRHSSAAVDFRFMAADILLACLLYVPLYTGIRALSTKIMSALVVDRLSWEPPHSLPPTAVLLAALVFLLLLDFVNYWAHVWFHKSSVLWSFHQVHHSAEVLTPATANRVHPIENIIVAILQAPVVALSAVLYQNIVGPDRQFIMIGGITVIGFSLTLLGTHLRHSHIWFSFGPWLNRILISPAHHQIHHSIEARHWNKNFGAKFTIWDALFGTLYQPHRPEAFRIGLPNGGMPEFTTVRQLYFVPFANAARRFFAWPARRVDAVEFGSRS